MADEKEREAFRDERLSLFIAAWVKALESNTVGSFVGDNPKPAIILPTKLSLEGAIEVLKKNNLKSAPVYDEWENCVGMLNMAALLKWSIRTKQNANLLFGFDSFMSKQNESELHVDMGVDAKKNDLTYLARMKKFNTVDVKETLLSLGQKLRGTPAVGVTRKGKLISVVSQGHFVKAVNKFGWLNEQRVTLGDLIDEGKCPTKIDTCTNDQTTYKVFFEMARLNRSAMGVLDKESGAFVGSLNLMDTRTFHDLDGDSKVTEYLSKQKKSALVCEKETLVVAVMSKICSKQSNRIWVVEDKKAVAICSLTDVLALVS